MSFDTDLEMLNFTGERIVPEADNCEPLFALKMYQEHIARYLFAAQVCNGKRVLDVGCGVGYGAQLLARSGASEVVAFDISEQAIRHALRFYYHRRVKHFVGSAEALSISGTFHLITCFELIEHVEQQHKVLEELRTALAPDGVLIISTPRPTGGKRSAFHTRELQFIEFANLLQTHFSHQRFFFENNHFGSLIACEQPTNIDAIHSIHPQFNLGQADYFVAVASQSPFDPNWFRPQLVLNNDEYVRSLERDVEILHRIEDELKARVAAAEEEARAASHARESARLEVAETKAANAALAEDLTALAEDLAAVNAGKTKLANDVTALKEVNTRLQEEAAELAIANARLESDVSGLKDENIRLLDEYQNLEAARTALRQEAAVWQQRATEHTALLDSLRRQVDSLYCSASWRVTMPLRRTLDVLLAARRWVQRPEVVQKLSKPEASDLSAADPITSALQTQPASFRGRTRLDVLYVIGCHEGESKRYRVHNLVEGLRVLGYDAESILDNEVPGFIQSGICARVLVLFRVGDTQPARQAIEWARAHGVCTVFDIDDLVFEPESIEFVRAVSRFSHPERAQYVRGVEQYQKMLLSADLVTCTTAFLADRIEKLGKQARVVPNSLNARQIQIAEQLISRANSNEASVRIGYFSGSNTHQVDFSVCERALLHVMQAHETCVLVLGGILDLSDAWKPYAHRVQRLPLMPYEPMLEALSGVSINLAPLEIGNPYCEGKSQLKIFEAGLVRVPTIASSTASYREAIDHGIDGYLASTEEDWIDALEQLIADPSLRAQVGERARERALRNFSPVIAAEAAAKAYGLMTQEHAGEDAQILEPPNERSTVGDRRLKITWIVPRLIIGGGGHRNILRAAYHLHCFGHDIALYFINTDQTEEELARDVRRHFYPLSCPIYVYRGSIRQTDVLFATHWSTVDAAVRARGAAGELMYFVQDFEPAFAPMGTEYVLAENTYRLGLYHITSGPWCEHVLKNQFGCDADHFVFPIDTSVYYPRARQKPEANIIFFAKPEMPRRCFELGIMALEEFHRLRPDVEITLFGSRHVEEKRIPFPAKMRALLPTIDDLAELYANADVGIVFSTTNPSLVPYEMMACGLPVVDLGRPGNEINYGGRYDLALLADPAPAIMAQQIRELLQNASERGMRSQNGLEFVRTFPSEEAMARRVEELILRRLTERKSGKGKAAEVCA